MRFGTHGAHEERREHRLVDELVHDDGEDVRAEDVRHGEAHADRCDGAGQLLLAATTLGSTHPRWPPSGRFPFRTRAEAP